MMLCCKFHKDNYAVGSKFDNTEAVTAGKSGRVRWEYVPECKQPTTLSLNNCSITQAAFDIIS